jgi:hypothetical protein
MARQVKAQGLRKDPQYQRHCRFDSVTFLPQHPSNLSRFSTHYVDNIRIQFKGFAIFMTKRFQSPLLFRVRSRLNHGVWFNRTTKASAMPFITLAPTRCALAHLYLSRIWISFVHHVIFRWRSSYKKSGSWRLGKSILIYPGYTIENLVLIPSL